MKKIVALFSLLTWASSNIYAVNDRLKPFVEALMGDALSMANPAKPITTVMRERWEYLIPEVAGILLEDQFSWKEATLRTQNLNSQAENQISTLSRSATIPGQSADETTRIWADINTAHPITAHWPNPTTTILQEEVDGNNQIPHMLMNPAHAQGDCSLTAVMGSGDVPDAVLRSAAKILLQIPPIEGEIRVDLGGFWARRKQIGCNLSFSTPDGRCQVQFPMIMSKFAMPSGIRKRVDLRDDNPNLNVFSLFNCEPRTFSVNPLETEANDGHVRVLAMGMAGMPNTDKLSLMQVVVRALERLDTQVQLDAADEQYAAALSENHALAFDALGRMNMFWG